MIKKLPEALTTELAHYAGKIIHARRVKDGKLEEQTFEKTNEAIYNYGKSVYVSVLEKYDVQDYIVKRKADRLSAYAVWLAEKTLEEYIDIGLPQVKFN